jgi:hypothetical protein
MRHQREAWDYCPTIAQTSQRAGCKAARRIAALVLGSNCGVIDCHGHSMVPTLRPVTLPASHLVVLPYVLIRFVKQLLVGVEFVLEQRAAEFSLN